MIASSDPADIPPFWLPVLAGLPIGLCLVVLALPALGNGQTPWYRVLTLALFLVWIFPLTAIQRALWHRRLRWWLLALVLLTITYLLSLANNALRFLIEQVAGDGLPSFFTWTQIFRGLEACWLALIAFCAIHAVVAYYSALKHEQTRRMEAQSLARDAELRALRYQLHPHFLFNTLNAISALVADERNREARQMIAGLGDFLRATLDGANRHEVALTEELAMTQTYLAIEKVRMGDRLQLKWNIGPEVMRASVPYLLLQPLVENAIRHGIALRSQPGKLVIDIYRDGPRLRIVVRNDGVPTSVASGTAERQTPMLGLRNVAERLDKLYSGDHTFSVRAGDDGGYEVRIDLPLGELENVNELRRKLA